MSGPALGRKTNETEAKEKRLMYQDACEPVYGDCKVPKLISPELQKREAERAKKK